MNPAEIMNFSYLDKIPTHGSRGSARDNSGYNHTKKNASGRHLNGYTSQNGVVDNYDCINELLDEGLEHAAGSRRRERVSIGEEVDRRRVFPTDNGHAYKHRSHTLHQ